MNKSSMRRLALIIDESKNDSRIIVVLILQNYDFIVINNKYFKVKFTLFSYLLFHIISNQT